MFQFLNKNNKHQLQHEEQKATAATTNNNNNMSREGSSSGSAQFFSSPVVSCELVRMRCSIVGKIMEEQTSLVDVLSFSMEKLKPELEHLASRIEYNVDEHQVRDVLSNTDELLGCERTVRMKLRETHEREKYEGSAVGSLFYNMRDHMRHYEEYFNNYARISKVVAHIEKTTVVNELDKFRGSIQLDEDRKVREGFLRAIVMQPLAYVCQMSVLLKMLAVFTTPTHADLRDVIKAYQLFQNLVIRIEESQQKQLLREAYYTCDRFQNEWDRIGITNKSGFATKRGGNVKSWKIRYFTIRHYEMKYFEEPLHEKPLGTLDLRHCQRVFSDSAQEKQNCMGLEMKDRTYYMYFTSVNERAEWMHLIAWKSYLLKSVAYRAKQAVASIKNGAFPTALSLIA